MYTNILDRFFEPTTKGSYSLCLLSGSGYDLRYLCRPQKHTLIITMLQARWPKLIAFIPYRLREKLNGRAVINLVNQ